MNINPNDVHALSDIKNSTIDILGLTTLGDKHIIKVIPTKAYKINIYCNSIKSYESRENGFNDVLDKCTFYCNYSYPGFQKEDNTSCELCKILSNDN